jgi:hypothetical protein
VTWRRAASFVADGLLTNWQWRVQAFDSSENSSGWSDWAPFEFQPCRLDDGTTPCHAP